MSQNRPKGGPNLCGKCHGTGDCPTCNGAGALRVDPPVDPDDLTTDRDKCPDCAEPWSGKCDGCDGTGFATS